MKRNFKSRIKAIWADPSGVIGIISDLGVPYVACTQNHWNTLNPASSLRTKWTDNYKIFPKGKFCYSQYPDTLLISDTQSQPNYLTIPVALQPLLATPYIKDNNINVTIQGIS